MTHLLNPTIEELADNPEVKSYIYQQISEFEPYVTPETIAAVIAKDPRKLKMQLETEGKEDLIPLLPKMHRIVIILKEGDTKIQEEGLSSDIYEAIRLAKNKLLEKLQSIQDQVMTKSERLQQIESALKNTQTH